MKAAAAADEGANTANLQRNSPASLFRRLPPYPAAFVISETSPTPINAAARTSASLTFWRRYCLTTRPRAHDIGSAAGGTNIRGAASPRLPGVPLRSTPACARPFVCFTRNALPPHKTQPRACAVPTSSEAQARGLSHTFFKIHTQVAPIPSPLRPSPSSVVAFTLTASGKTPHTRAIFSLI